MSYSASAMPSLDEMVLEEGSLLVDEPEPTPADKTTAVNVLTEG